MQSALSNATGCLATSFALGSVAVTSACGGGAGDDYCDAAPAAPAAEQPFWQSPGGLALIALAAAVVAALAVAATVYGLVVHARTSAVRAATLMHGMRRQKKKYGMITMCIGTGMGAAGVFEAL